MPPPPPPLSKMDMLSGEKIANFLPPLFVKHFPDELYSSVKFNDYFI